MVQSSELPTPSEILKTHYRAWEKLIATQSSFDTLTRHQDFGFLIDQKGNPESKFTGESILAEKLNEPVEEYATNNVPSDFKSEEGETWIGLTIKPKDPYRSKIAVWKETDGREFYYTEGLDIYLSSLGRAFQSTSWYGTLEPDIHDIKRDSFSYMKTYPDPSEIVELKGPEPEAGNTDAIIDSPEPLDGHNIERLNFLLDQIGKGNIIQ
ncbi:MAG TPA: hypothetical protein VLE91_00155 [Candidatus Saccharimonadales bacterium]|nr:hypothetical protein [Candidatus Saccharimonadales bacterium]